MIQYVKAMAHSLSVFDDNKQKMKYYEAMSWGGLETSSNYKKFSKFKKDSIQTIINNERYSKKDAKSYKCK